MQLCSRCGIDLPEDRTDHYCADCRADANDARDKTKRNERERTLRQEKKQELLDHIDNRLWDSWPDFIGDYFVEDPQRKHIANWLRYNNREFDYESIRAYCAKFPDRFMTLARYCESRFEPNPRHPLEAIAPELFQPEHNSFISVGEAVRDGIGFNPPKKSKWIAEGDFILRSNEEMLQEDEEDEETDD